MRKLLLPLTIFLVGVLLSSMYVVDQAERGIVVRFGRILDDGAGTAKIRGPGLHFKLPIFDTVHKLDARLQTMDGSADRFVTSEKKDVIIDSFVKWRITDFGKFYLATGGGNILTAEALLQRRVADGLRNQIGSKTIQELVSEKRDQVMDAVLVSAQRSSEDLGITVVDVRIKKINLPDEISESIYQRMRAEREAVARRHRSQGREKAEVLRAQAELEVAITLAEAEREALTKRGEADAEVARVYADAFNKDAEFFAFLRSLSAYEASFSSKNDVMVLDPNSEFFRFMKDPLGGKAAE
ncbi:protease modulator HflC [Thaumasiovibrio subtropicus]|uniref:protease modulator HflC n=1 Tax=Thaumasiovibrio subtropicus TaxID=1891207 RepID=UPI000B34BF53|nr:protease modulator HflC [Thaumasiovibrio subtropicus]